MVADTDAPNKIAYGETITPTATGTVTLPAEAADAIRAVNAKRIDGKADVAATVDGAASPWVLTIPQTNVPPQAATPMTLEGSGPAGTFEGTQVGTVYDLAIGNFTATLNLYEANGTALPAPFSPQTVVCTLNPGQNPAVDTIKVVKDTTTTTVKARDISKGAKAKAKVKVVSDHGTDPQGQDQGQAGPQRHGLADQDPLAARRRAEGHLRPDQCQRATSRFAPSTSAARAGRPRRAATPSPSADAAGPCAWVVTRARDSGHTSCGEPHRGLGSAVGFLAGNLPSTSECT